MSSPQKLDSLPRLEVPGNDKAIPPTLSFREMLCRSCHFEAVQVCLQKRVSSDTALISTTDTHLVMYYVYRLPVEKATPAAAATFQGKIKTWRDATFSIPWQHPPCPFPPTQRPSSRLLLTMPAKPQAHTTVGLRGHTAAQHGEVRQPWAQQAGHCSGL